MDAIRPRDDVRRGAGRRVSAPVLDRRALNRALLARQMLLERAPLGASEAVERLVGLQGQAPDAPYVGLWSRLEGFAARELASLVEERKVVRAPLMRGTIHAVGARDALALRPLVQPVLERAFASNAFARRLDGADPRDVAAAGRALVEERPRTRAELGRTLAERWPGGDPSSLAHAVTFLVALVQVPPRGVWRRRGQATWTTIEAWVGRPLQAEPSLEGVVLRYLAAFGPASAMDVQAWSGLTRLRDVVERLRPRLVTFRDARGGELFDLPDAPRPDPDTPAPPRFLPEYDNVLLSHADRSRVMDEGSAIPLLPGNGGTSGTFLIDGFLAGEWRAGPGGLDLSPYAPLRRRDAAALAREGERLLTFVDDQ